MRNVLMDNLRPRVVYVMYGGLGQTVLVFWCLLASCFRRIDIIASALLFFFFSSEMVVRYVDNIGKVDLWKRGSLFSGIMQLQHGISYRK